MVGVMLRMNTLFAGVVVALLAAPGMPPARAQQSPTTLAMPDAEKVVLLIRGALLTLNDAVQTGNFTVLRDKAAPSFRSANTAASLSIIFQDLSRQGSDYSTIAVLTPQLTQAPVIDAQRRLRLAGYFASKPRLDFELVFESVEGRWRVFGISANPIAAAPDAKAASTKPVKK